VEFEEDWLKRLLFLADGKPVGWDTGLDGVKKVLVLHAV
jgi:hypothetical protein